MQTVTVVLIVVVLALLGSSAFQVYESFHAPRCPVGSVKKTCSLPLFGDGELVDFHMFLTTDKKLKWWTSKGIAELRHIPFWNKTSVKFGQSVEPILANVSLSSEKLGGVRRNESALHAHLFMLRAGSSLDDAVKLTTGKPEVTGMLSSNVLHATATLTQTLPLIVKEKRSLLGNNATHLQKTGNDSNASEAVAGKDVPAAFVTVPLVNVAVPVYPNDALAWAAAAFGLSAFMRPSKYTAAPRQFLAVALVPWLTLLRQQQAAEQQAAQVQLQEERRAFEVESLFKREQAPLYPHLIPNVKISLGADAEEYDARYPAPLLYNEMFFGKGEIMPWERPVRYDVIKTFAGGLRYVPPLAIDHFGIQKRYWRLLDSNASKADPSVPVEIEVNSMLRYSFVQTIKQSLDVYIHMGFTEQDLDDVQDWLFRHPLHILALMQAIGFVQMILTTMAFKNDISFFKGRSDYRGLSSRTLATDTMQEIIIFLYLYDFDQISRIILAQVGSSAVIGAWKFMRVARLGIVWSHMLPWISSNRASLAGKDEQSTDEIDARGMFYLKIVLYPLSAAWGLYNIYNYTYKSWWSWLVSSMADFAYTFGFINMMPQIFINYKLKSVAHMPWRVLMYKFFNTFIDDVFAFFIMSDYMSAKHRWMTLRDDIVFFVFLYQLYLYKVDSKRADEFGFVYGEAALAEMPAEEPTLEPEERAVLADGTESADGLHTNEVSATAEAAEAEADPLVAEEQQSQSSEAATPDDGVHGDE